MYNAHRGIAGAPAPPNARLVELLEQVRAEFEAQGGRANEYEHQRESSPVCSLHLIDPPPALLHLCSMRPLLAVWSAALCVPPRCSFSSPFLLPLLPSSWLFQLPILCLLTILCMI
jgi:hypothetical protein